MKYIQYGGWGGGGSFIFGPHSTMFCSLASQEYNVVASYVAYWGAFSRKVLITTLRLCVAFNIA